jgi:HEAT repeat protein
MQDVVDRLAALVRDDPEAPVRREAARALGVSGADGVDPLLGALGDADGGVQRAAVLALGRTGDPRAVEALLDVLRTRPDLWEEASAALATVRAPHLAERLVPLLDAAEPEVRRGAVRALGAVVRPALGEQVGEEPLFVYTDADGHRHPLF